MNIAKTIVFAVSMILAGSTAYAGARDHDQNATQDATAKIHNKVQRMLQKFDTNSDGVLDASELEAMVAQRMQHRAGKRKQRLSRLFNHLDTNRDGALSRSEVSASGHGRGGAGKLQKRFQIIDTNNDGLLTRAELKQAAHKHGWGKHGHKGKRGRGMRGGAQ